MREESKAQTSSASTARRVIFLNSKTEGSPNWDTTIPSASMPSMLFVSVLYVHNKERRKGRCLSYRLEFRRYQEKSKSRNELKQVQRHETHIATHFRLGCAHDYLNKPSHVRQVAPTKRHNKKTKGPSRRCRRQACLGLSPTKCDENRLQVIRPSFDTAKEQPWIRCKKRYLFQYFRV